MEVFDHTWPVLMRTVTASVLVIVPTALLILFLSTLTARRGYLAFLWIGFIIGSSIVSEVIGEVSRSPENRQRASLCSYGANLLTVSEGVLGAHDHIRNLQRYSPELDEIFGGLEERPFKRSLVVLFVLAGGSLILTTRLVRAQDRGWG